jgi:hypothetical protein
MVLAHADTRNARTVEASAPPTGAEGGLGLARVGVMKSHFTLGLPNILAIGLGVLAVVGCSGAGGGGADGTSNDGWTGQTNVEAIFESDCSGCHGTQWSSCWDVQADAQGVEALVSSGAMPRSGSLSSSDRSTLLAWLGQGAPCTGPKPAGGSSSSGGGGGLPPVVAAGDAP